jgi:hypothetical protein
MNYALKKIKIFGISSIFFILPQIVLADGVGDLIDAAFRIVTNILIPLAFALCLLYFFWGVAKYIRTGATSEKAAEEGKRVMIWGIVGLFIAFSIWSIIGFIRSELVIPDIQNVEKPSTTSVNSNIIW